MAVTKGPNKGRSERYAVQPPRADRRLDRESTKGNPELNDVRWITEEDDKLCAKQLTEFVHTLATDQGYRLWENTRYYSLYANTDFLSANRSGATGAGTGSAITPMPRMAFNKIKINTDTLVGKLIESNSRIQMTTSEGDFITWNKARKIEWALEGEWSRMKLYPKVSQIATDAVVAGTGWLKLYIEKGRVCGERVMPNEVFVDQIEAVYGPPKKMYQLRYVKKDTLLRLYPDKADVIRAAKTVNPPRFNWTTYTPGMVEVVEGWALPIGERAGRHVISVASGTLLDETWNEEFFPLIPFKAGYLPFSWYGQGFTEQVMGAQLDLNKTWATLQRAAHMGIAPYWVVQEGASINHKHLNNDVGHIVETSGADPKWFTNEPFHPEALQYLDRLGASIDQFYGNSAMESTGQNNMNRLDSQKALVEAQDIGATRHAVMMENWQNFFVEAAERTIMLAKRIAKADGKYPVLVKKSAGKAMTLDWKDLDIGSDPYVMQCAPSNMLSRTVAGKMNDIQGMVSSGLLTQAQGAQLMRGPPDVDAAVSEVSAPEDYTDYVISQIVEEGNLVRPTQLDDLARMAKRISDARYQYIIRGAPDETISLFEEWLVDAQQITTQQQAAAGQPSAGVVTNDSGSSEPSSPVPGNSSPAPAPAAGSGQAAA